jgi:hypothetical protein
VRIVNIVLVRKNRIQPETIEALQDAIDSGRDVSMIFVDDTELDAIVPLQITAKEVKAMRAAQPQPQQPPPPPPPPPITKDADLAQALRDGEERAARKAGAKKA